jgi:hypothetical protein
VDKKGARDVQFQLDKYKDLKLQLDGFLKPGEQHKRNVLLDSVYASLPKDSQAKVLVFSAEVMPGGYTNWHCHNGATFFVCTQGLFEAHFQEGTILKADERLIQRILQKLDTTITKSSRAVTKRCAQAENLKGDDACLF